MDSKDLTCLSFQVYSICVPIGCMNAPEVPTLIRRPKPSSRNKPWIMIMRAATRLCVDSHHQHGCRACFWKMNDPSLNDFNKNIKIKKRI